MSAHVFFYFFKIDILQTAAFGHLFCRCYLQVSCLSVCACACARVCVSSEFVCVLSSHTLLSHCTLVEAVGMCDLALDV